MNSVLYLVRRPPGLIAEETADMVLVSGVFGQPTTLVFMDDGIYQLLDEYRNHQQNDTARKWSALPTYEIDRVYVHLGSIQKRDLDRACLPEFASLVSDTQVDELLHAADSVVSG